MIRPRHLAALAAAVLTCLLVPALAAATTATTATTPKGENTPLRLDDGADPAIASSSSGGSIVRTIVGLAIVLAVIYGVYWVLQQIKTSRDESTTGEGLQTVSSLGLGPNRSLHLVRAGNDVMLIGVAEHAVTTVRSYTEAEAVAAGLLPIGGWAERDRGVPAASTAVAARPQPAPIALISKVLGINGHGAARRRPGARQPMTIGQLLGSLREKTVRS